MYHKRLRKDFMVRYVKSETRVDLSILVGVHVPAF